MTCLPWIIIVYPPEIKIQLTAKFNAEVLLIPNRQSLRIPCFDENAAEAGYFLHKIVFLKLL